VKAKKEYQAMERAGTLTDVDEIRFERLKRQERIRVRKQIENRIAEKKLARAADDSLFIPQDDDLQALDESDDDEPMDDADTDGGSVEESGEKTETLLSAKEKKKAKVKSNEKKRREPRTSIVQGENARVHKTKQPASRGKNSTKQKTTYNQADIASLLTGNLVCSFLTVTRTSLTIAA
jgi:hypothetical protein